MQIRIGDQVRFISEKTEGKVTSIINESTVNVFCDEYGFEIPATVSDLVIIPSSKSEKEVTATSNTQTRETTERSGTIYLAIVPDNSKNLNESLFEIHLINDTQQTILYSVYFRTNNRYKGVTAGNCNSGNNITIGSYSLKDIDADIKAIHAQIIFFEEKSEHPLQPIDMEVKINPVNLCKASSYKQSDWFNHLAILYPLKKEQKLSFPESEPELIKEPKKETLTKETSASTPSKNNIIEIDLHIDKLLDTTSGMDNSDILEYQLETFRQTLNTYKLRKGQKIVFIHGKGDGVLRQRILWELQTAYKRFNHQDASFKQYGYGATMVTIK